MRGRHHAKGVDLYVCMLRKWKWMKNSMDVTPSKHDVTTRKRTPAKTLPAPAGQGRYPLVEVVRAPASVPEGSLLSEEC